MPWTPLSNDERANKALSGPDQLRITAPLRQVVKAGTAAMAMDRPSAWSQHTRAGNKCEQLTDRLDASLAAIGAQSLAAGRSGLN